MTKVFGCPTALTLVGSECCLGPGWRQYIRPVCDGTEEFCGPCDDRDICASIVRDPERSGTPEAMEGY